MIIKLNKLIEQKNPSLRLSYEIIKKEYAHDLVRERHIAKALRILAMENFSTSDEQLNFLETLYNGKKSKTGLSDKAALENEIRSNLLKSGGAAFVEEDETWSLKKSSESLLRPEGYHATLYYLMTHQANSPNSNQILKSFIALSLVLE
jgi:hypothetical protein